MAGTDTRRPLWAGLSPDEHEFQYNPQRAFPDFAEAGKLRAAANARARETLRREHDLAYGEHPLRRLDIYRADLAGGPPVPAHLFLHGGYWRAQDKTNFAALALTLVPRGVSAVIANYELCPESTLDAVADSALEAFAWLYRNGSRYGIDPNRLGISGHSAGAHLCAELLAADWPARGLPPDAIRSAVLVSGIYDPAPARLTSVNELLRLDDGLIERHNLEVRPPRVCCPLWLFAGGREPWQWIDQSFRYSHHLRRHGLDPEVRVLPGYGHFDILQEYQAQGSSLMRALLGGL